jgi:two-component system, cell cycle sensor histidine kinase and response regulator CckA
LKKISSHLLPVGYLHQKLGLRAILFLGCFILTSALGAVYVFFPQAFQVINLSATDFVLKSSVRREAETEVMIVEIDEASLKSYGQWPWPRYLLADLLQKIAEAGPAAVGVNIVFAERDRTSPVIWQQTLKDKYGYTIDTTNIPAELVDNDIYLSNVLGQGPFVLGYEFLFDEGNSGPHQCALKPVSLQVKGQSSQPLTGIVPHQARGVICNYEVLAGSVARAGFLNGAVDKDGVLRRLPLIIGYQEEVYPSFALAVLMEYFKHDVLVYNNNTTQVPDFSLLQQKFLVDIHGNYILDAPKRKESGILSAVDILQGKAATDILKDKIVFVGLAASGLSQTFPTLFSSTASFLELHRCSIESLLATRMTIRPNYFRNVELGAGFIFMLVMVLCASSLTTFWSTVICGMSIALLWTLCISIQSLFGYLFSPLLPTLSLLANICLGLLLRFQYLQNEARLQAGAALNQLKTSEHSLQSILRTIPDIVFRLDPKGRIIYISQAVSAYVDSPERLLGQSVFKMVAPEDLNRAQFRMNERRTGGRATRDLEICLQFSNGSSGQAGEKRFFSVSSQGIYEDNRVTADAFLGTQGIVKDITEKKQLEHELIQAQKMEVVGSLAAGIAHDLNNILSGLVSYPDLLLREIGQESPLYDKIAMIQKSGRKAAAIVHDLLTLARRNINKSEVCSLNEIVREYTDSVEFRQICENHPDVTVQLDLADDVLNFRGSAVHLSKVVMNILQNGLEAMEKEGRILVKTRNVYLDAPLLGYESIDEGEYVCLSITDEGMGIAKEDLDRVFEPFFTKKSMGRSGTGLGMSVIWATVKDHKGFIDIQSEAGVGTTCTVYLRPTRERSRSQDVISLPEEYEGNETILVVDDIPEQLNLAKGMLEFVGYNVVTVSSGEKAVAYIKENPVDLVVLDMIMPGGWDGLETYQQIIRHSPDQKSIITSGYSASERVSEVQTLGGGEYVQKPFSMHTLLKAVREELDRKQ